MNYQSIGYFALFIPLVMVVYSICKKKYRPFVLLLASYVFFYLYSGWLLLFNILFGIAIYGGGRVLEKLRKCPKDYDKKVFKKRKANLLRIMVILCLIPLIGFKYTNFIGETIFGSSFKVISIVVPVGISYFTLMGISYLVDVYNKKVHCGSLLEVLLFVSFFPSLVQGPFMRFDEMRDMLVGGYDITYESLTHGYQRMLWGLFKKICIADYLGIAVTKIFSDYTSVGSMSLFGGILCTIQLYMDFCGTIDIAMGSAYIFGIKLPENFRQPFFAKNAGDFWHRWHITLGTFFRDYIFYPISLSSGIRKLNKHLSKRVSRYVGPCIALLFVWLANGFWHGANWTYVGYGLYYFVLMVIELFLEKPFDNFVDKHHIPAWLVKSFRFIKLCIIVVIGETFFRASSFEAGWQMFMSVFNNFDSSVLINNWSYLGLGGLDYCVAFGGFMVVIVVSVLKEMGISIRYYFEKLPTWSRWGFWYIAILVVVLVGAYGPGYSGMAMMYAGF